MKKDPIWAEERNYNGSKMCTYIQIYPKNDQSNRRKWTSLHSPGIGNTTPPAKTVSNAIQQMVALGLLNALDQMDHIYKWPKLIQWSHFYRPGICLYFSMPSV